MTEAPKTTETDLGLKIEWDQDALRWVASGLLAYGPRGAAIITEATTIPELLRKAADRAEAMLREGGMTETHEQRVGRLAEVIYQHMVGLPFETVPVGEQEFGRRTARAVIASDREAGMVTVPRAISGEMEAAITERLWKRGHVVTSVDSLEAWEAAIAAHEQEG